MYEEVPGLHVDQESEFAIDLVSSKSPISKELYIAAPDELVKLKV